MKTLVKSMLLGLIASSTALSASSEEEKFYHIHPQWSADGSEIIFYEWYRGRDVFTRIMSANPETGDITPVTSDTFFNANPGFFGGSKDIIYASARPGMRSGDWEIYKLERATGKTIKLTDRPQRAGHPTISPDGKTLVFQQKVDREGQTGFLTDLFAQNLETGKVIRLTDTDGNEFHPKFMPDSKAVVFDRMEDGLMSVHRINIDGSHDMRILNHGKDVRAGVPMVSPDGNWVAYSFGPMEPENSNVRITNLQTGKSKMLTHYEGHSIAGVSWSPDSKKIAYSYGPGKPTFHIAIVDIETGEITSPFYK